MQLTAVSSVEVGVVVRSSCLHARHTVELGASAMNGSWQHPIPSPLSECLKQQTHSGLQGESRTKALSNAKYKARLAAATTYIPMGC